MKISLFLAAAIVLSAVGLSFAGDRHHHRHFGRHYHSSHGYHYGLHSYSHRRHHSGFSFGLSFGRPYGYYGYGSSARNYGYSYPRYYSYPRSYRVYSYSYPSCVIQIAPATEVQVPQTQPPKRKVDPAPPRVEPSESNPNIDSSNERTDSGQPASVASSRRLQRTDGTSELPVLGLQNFGTQSRRLTSDESIPFVVSPHASHPVASDKTKTALFAGNPDPAPPILKLK